MDGATQVRKIDRKWKLCHNPLYDPTTNAYKQAEVEVASKRAALHLEKVCSNLPGMWPCSQYTHYSNCFLHFFQFRHIHAMFLLHPISIELLHINLTYEKVEDCQFNRAVDGRSATGRRYMQRQCCQG